MVGGETPNYVKITLDYPKKHVPNRVWQLVFMVEG